MKIKQRKLAEDRRPRFKGGKGSNPHPKPRFSKNFRDLLREYLDSGKAQGIDKDELVEIALKKAQRGSFFFWSKLVDLHEADTVNEDDLQSFIERVYLTVRRHVEKLDGGKEALTEIARDLQKEPE